MDDWKRNDRVAATLSNDWVASYSAGFVLPTLTRTDSVAVLDTFMRSPKLGEHPHLSVRRVYADFETTKHPAVKYHAAKSANRWPVYKGESFDLWTSDTGTHFAYADEREVLTALQAKRLRGGKDSSYAKCAREWREDPKTLPQLAPRICFRETTNRTNTRTFLVARIPARVITTQTAPWILWLDAGHPTQQEDFLLGVLSTRIFDWWMRRFVEVHVDEEAFLSMRVPRWSESDRFAARVVAISRQIERESPSKSAAELERNQHELEAVVALLYGLPEPQVRHVFETFHEGWEYRPHLEAVLTYFRKWNSNAP